MDYKNWKEIKYRDIPSIEWTGNNIKELEEFAREHAIGFSIGSNVRCEGCRHVCTEEPDVLEVYSSDWFDKNDDDEPVELDIDDLPTWTHADPGDIIFANGEVAHYGQPIPNED